jgi:intracellular septation protein
MFKFITEFGPLVAFFVGYKTSGILEATLYMLVASVIAISITYIYERKINKVNLISTALLLISASLTLFSGNSIFIKMKPTVLYCLFASVFFITNYKWNPAIKYVLGHAIKLKGNEHWYTLNLRFMWFFFVMAILNELVWRNLDESTWVSFKVFGALPLTLVFVMLQVPFIIKHQNKDDIA